MNYSPVTKWQLAEELAENYNVDLDRATTLVINLACGQVIIDWGHAQAIRVLAAFNYEGWRS